MPSNNLLNNEKENVLPEKKEIRDSNPALEMIFLFNNSGFSGRKNPKHKSSERDFKAVGLESEILGSLKTIKPEK